MNEFPVMNESLNRIYEQSLSMISANALAAGVKLCVFDNLREPVTVESLAKKQGLNPGATQVLLDTLTSCGHLHKKDGMYGNMPDSARFWVSNDPRIQETSW